MKKIKKTSISFILIMSIIFGYILPIGEVFAATDVTTQDFSAINSLDKDYSYSTVFWTDETEINAVEGENTAFYYNNLPATPTYRAKEGEVISLRMTKCAVDQDGDLCDVLLKVNDITTFTNSKENTDYPGARALIAVRKYGNTNLAQIWFETTSASGNFTMKYVKTGTNTAANVKKVVSSIYDFDAQFANQEGDIWEGQEGISIENAKKGTIYYQKDGSWLVDAKNSENEVVGVRIPNRSVIPQAPDEVLPDISIDGERTNNNQIIKMSTAVVTEEIDDATYKLFYAGYGCGIGFVFLSPYTYELDEPIKTADKTQVSEGETFNYKISQYVPNNYYGDALDFIDGVRGKYTNFNISDTLNSNLNIKGDIKVTNESNTDVTNYFNITTTDNVVSATVKSEQLSDVNFYAHTYTLNIPVSAKTGTDIATIPNVATTTATPGIDNTGTETKTSNTVNTDLKYTVTVNATIDNGTTKINTGTANQRTNYSMTTPRGVNIMSNVSFNPKAGYSVVSVHVDGNEIPETEWKTWRDNWYEIDGSSLQGEKTYYQYNFFDQMISDITHNIIINTEPNDATVTIKYVDEEGKEIATPETLTGKVDQTYTTTPKNIKNYEVKTAPTNANGIYGATPTTVTYIYKLKDTTVTTKYIDTDTKQELADSITKTGKVGDSYTTEEKTFEGYRLVAKPVNSQGTMTEEPIEVIYNYTKKSSSIVANYVDEDGKQISPTETKTGTTGENYSTENKEIKGYELVSVPTNATGKYTEDTITVNYVYKLKDAKVVVKYVDKNGKEIADSTTINGKYFEKYDTSSKTITNYNLTTVPTNASGTMQEDTTTVTYVYDLKPTYVTVNYIDENGKQIINPEKIEGKIGEKYTTEAKKLEGYELKTTPANSSGTMTEKTIIVNYIYKAKGRQITELPRTGNSQAIIVCILIITVFSGTMAIILRSDKYRSF